MTRFDSACNVCGSSNFRIVAERSDGIPVAVCSKCGHGVAQSVPEDVRALYDDHYFASAEDSRQGYTDYAYTAEHGIAWAAALIRFLRPEGRLLDIGCADGLLLRKLGSAYQRFGIELNPRMAEECRRSGVEIIASDLIAGNLTKYAESFDLIAAIAVFEHIPDFRGAFETALALLGPNGLLLFEVPIISASGGSDMWFRSSLEHIHYPSEGSLQYLFRDVLNLQLVGAVVPIKDFACTYIGLTSKSGSVIEAAGQRLERLFQGRPADLLPDESRVRWLLDVIHAGNASPEVLALSEHLADQDLNPHFRRRVFDLWRATELRSSSLEHYLHEVEGARDWHAAQVKKRDDIIAAQLQEMAVKDNALSVARELNDSRVQQIREIESSWSWRLTAPLRMLARKAMLDRRRR
jgi:SAM-dependent methyltransferase